MGCSVLFRLPHYEESLQENKRFKLVCIYPSRGLTPTRGKRAFSPPGRSPGAGSSRSPSGAGSAAGDGAWEAIDLRVLQPRLMKGIGGRSKGFRNSFLSSSSAALCGLSVHFI